MGLLLALMLVQPGPAECGEEWIIDGGCIWPFSTGDLRVDQRPQEIVVTEPTGTSLACSNTREPRTAGHYIQEQNGWRLVCVPGRFLTVELRTRVWPTIEYTEMLVLYWFPYGWRIALTG